MRRISLIVAMLSSSLLAQTSLAQTSLDGARVTIERDGKTERYRLVAQADVPPAGNTPSSNDTARFTIAGTELAAPALVSVHALSLGLDPLTTRFAWDFGDPASAHNRLDGFTAGHAYDKPGTYTITLSVTEEGKPPRTLTQRVTIQPDARKAIEISTSADLAKVRESPADDVRILLKRGEVLEIDRTLLVPGARVTLGAFGDPKRPRPVLRYTGTTNGEPIVKCNENTRSLVIEDITFDSNAPKPDAPAATVLQAAGKQITIRNCTFLNVNYCVNGNGKPAGVLIQDCEAPKVDTVRGYLAWVQGSDWTIVGNRFANSTRQHGIRGWEFARLLVAKNELTNVDRTSVDPIDIAKTTINLQAGEYAYVTANALHGPSSIGPLGKTDGLKYRDQRSRWYVVENNQFIGSALEIQHGLSNVMVRNNTFRVHDARSIAIDGYDSTYARGVTNVTLANNTALNDSTRGGFLFVGGRVDGITLVGNTYKAPKLEPGSHQTACVYVNDESLRSFRVISGNVWSAGKPRPYAQGGSMYVWPKWSDERGYLDAKEWSSQPQVKNDRFE